jgi:hypothetical protein
MHGIGNAGGGLPEGAERRAAGPRRRLSDKLLVAFHHACDQGQFDVAAELLQIVETVVSRPQLAEGGRDRRKAVEGLVAAYHRLWALRHPAS